MTARLLMNADFITNKLSGIAVKQGATASEGTVHKTIWQSNYKQRLLPQVGRISKVVTKNLSKSRIMRLLSVPWMVYLLSLVLPQKATAAKTNDQRGKPAKCDGRPERSTVDSCHPHQHQSYEHLSLQRFSKS